MAGVGQQARKLVVGGIRHPGLVLLALLIALTALVAPITPSHAQVPPSNADEDGSGDPSVGDTITYQITGSNTGGQVLTNVVVFDSFTGQSAACPSLAPGGTCILNVSYSITPADVAAGFITTTASATSDQTGPVTLPSPASVPIPQPRLAIQAAQPANADEDDSGGVSLGDTLTFRFTATNTGSANLTDVTVSDSLIAPSQGATSCALLAPGQTCEFQGTHVVSEDDVASGLVASTATATSSQANQAQTTVSVEVLAAPEVEVVAISSINLSTATSAANAGDTVSFAFEVRNTGSVTLTGVIVDAPAAGVDNCLIGTLLPGESSAACGNAHALTQADVDRGLIEGSATVTADSPAGPLSVVDAFSLEVERLPSIEIVKLGRLETGSDGIATPGDVIHYTFSVRNTGNTNLTDIVVVDEEAGVTGCPIGLLTPGEVDDTTCTGTYVLTQDDIDAGGVDDLAVAEAVSPTGVVTDQDGGARSSFDIPNFPGLDVERVLAANSDEDGSDGVSTGDSLTFLVTATNIGNIRLTNVRAGDDLTGDEDACGTLAPKGTCVLEYGYSVTEENGLQGGVPDLSYAFSDQTGTVRPEQPVSQVAGTRFELPTNFLNVTDGWRGINTDLAVIGTNLSIALLALLTLLVATTVFNSTLEENAAEVDAIVHRVSNSSGLAPIFAALGWMAADEAGGESRWLHYLKPLLIVFITAFIYALLEPNFGLNDETLVVMTALMAGIAMATFLYEGGQVFWASRHYETPASMRVYPMAIFIALGCVALTRITDLHPGIIFGFVTAAAIFPRGDMPERAKGLIIAVPLFALMIVATISLFLIDPLHDFAQDQGTVWSTLPETIAVALFVGGSESALLILMPVTFNDGQKIWAWSKLVWFIFAVPAAFAFFHVVVNEEDFGELVGDDGAMALIGVCLVVLTITVVTWLFFKLRSNDAAPA